MSRTPAQIASDVNALNTGELKKFNYVCNETDIYEMQTGAGTAIQNLAAEVDTLSETDLATFATELNTVSGGGKGSRRPC